MTDLTDIKSAIATLYDLLRTENDAIKRGDYTGLNISAIEKSKQITALEKTLFGLKSEAVKDALLPSLQTLQKQVSINATLLSSALNGVKSANNRLSMILDRERNTGTYDRRGRSVQMADSKPLQIKVL